jgi:hypothetical protein
MFVISNAYDFVGKNGLQPWDDYLIDGKSIPTTDYDRILDSLDYWKQVLVELRIQLLTIQQKQGYDQLRKNVDITFKNIYTLGLKLCDQMISREYDFAALREMRNSPD